MAQHNELGKWGEDRATDYLVSNGYIIRDRNWRHNHLELDIVAIDTQTDTLVFVEVKTRSSDLFGHPSQAVDLKKVDNTIRIGYYYSRFYHLDNKETRYDCIYIITKNDGTFTLEHRKDVMSVIDRYYYAQQKRKRHSTNNGKWGRFY